MTEDTIQERLRNAAARPGSSLSVSWLNASAADRIDALEAENARLTASVSELERQAEEVEQGHYRMAVAANEMIHKVWEHLGGQDPTREGGSNLVGRTAELRARADAAEAEVARLREELASRLSPSPPDGGQATDWLSVSSEEGHHLVGAAPSGAASAENARLTARIAVLEEALRPFADKAAAYDPDEGDGDNAAWASYFTIGHLRRARKALEG